MDVTRQLCIMCVTPFAMHELQTPCKQGFCFSQLEQNMVRHGYRKLLLAEELQQLRRRKWQEGACPWTKRGRQGMGGHGHMVH